MWGAPTQSAGPRPGGSCHACSLNRLSSGSGAVLRERLLARAGAAASNGGPWCWCPGCAARASPPTRASRCGARRRRCTSACRSCAGRAMCAPTACCAQLTLVPGLSPTTSSAGWCARSAAPASSRARISSCWTSTGAGEWWRARRPWTTWWRGSAVFGGAGGPMAIERRRPDHAHLSRLRGGDPLAGAPPDPRGRARRIGRVVYVGAPQRGTFDAVACLHRGFRFAPAGKLFSAAPRPAPANSWDALPHPDDPCSSTSRARPRWHRCDLYDHATWDCLRPGRPDDRGRATPAAWRALTLHRALDRAAAASRTPSLRHRRAAPVRRRRGSSSARSGEVYVPPPVPRPDDPLSATCIGPGTASCPRRPCGRCRACPPISSGGWGPESTRPSRPTPPCTAWSAKRSSRRTGSSPGTESPQDEVAPARAGVMGTPTRGMARKARPCTPRPAAPAPPPAPRRPRGSAARAGRAARRRSRARCGRVRSQGNRWQATASRGRGALPCPPRAAGGSGSCAQAGVLRSSTSRSRRRASAARPGRGPAPPSGEEVGDAAEGEERVARVTGRKAAHGPVEQPVGARGRARHEPERAPPRPGR